MAERLDRRQHFITQRNQPLIGIFQRDNGHEVVQYFTEEPQPDQATRSHSIQEVLNLAGSWHDLDWDDIEEELYCIRHESQPTPPLDL